MSAATWKDRDAATAVGVLNANASTFSGFDFRGWWADGDPFDPPEVDGSQKVAFGMVDVGRAFPVPGMRQGAARPLRSAYLRVEVYVSSPMVKAIRKEIYDAAADALEDHAPAGFAVSSQSWSGPSASDLEVPRFSNFRSVVATCPYWATSTV